MRLKKIILFSSFLAIFGFLFNFNVPTVKAATVEELLTQIQQLQARILLLQKQLTELQGQPAEWCHDFNTNIKWKDTGSEVEALQTILEKEGFQVSADEKTNKYFYTSTLETVMDFQLKYRADISKSAGYEIDCTGFVGSGTRVKLNELYGCAVVIPIKPACQTLWWYDNDHQYCQQKQFCGAYMYLGLHTFGTEAECKVAFITVATTTAGCTDSDGGLNYNVKGIVTGGATVNTDTCSVSGYLFEQYCLNGNPVQATYWCPYGCQDGACLVKCDGVNMVWDSGLTQSYNYTADACAGYRCLTGSKISPACYNSVECQNVCKGECVNISSAKNQCATTPSITVISPNGGDNWVMGNSYDILWKSIGNSDKVDIILRSPGGSRDKDIASQIPNTGSYLLRIPTNIVPANDYTVEIDAVCVVPPCTYKMGVNQDVSDAVFSIISATSVSCTDSDGGLNYYVRGKGTGLYGSGKEIGVIWGEDPTKCSARWDNTLNYSIDYDCCSDSAISKQLNEAYCDANGLLQAYGYTCPYGCKDGACLSTIVPSITVISPNGGETWKVGETRRISWTSSNVSYVRIYIQDVSGAISGSGVVNYVYDGAISASTGYYDWTIQKTQLPGYNLTFPRTYKIRIDGLNSSTIGTTPVVTDMSDNYFTIQDISTTSSITIISPNGGEKWEIGQTKQVQLYCSGMSKTIDIWLTNKYVEGGTITKLVSDTTCNGNSLYNVFVPSLASPADQSSYKILARTTDGMVSDESNSYFSIVGTATNPSLTVLSPNGGEKWGIGKTYQIKWSTNNKTSGVTISRYEIGPNGERYGGSNIAYVGPGIDYYNWTVPSNENTNWKIDISQTINGEDFYDTSDNYFSIIGVTTTEEMLVPGYDFYVKTSDTGTGNWNFAKSSCEALGSGWSLPTMAQLRVLYQKKNEIGGFKDQAYWSLDMGMYIHFSNGFESSMNPAMTFPAFRCVKKADGMGLKVIESQLASLAEVVSRLMEQIKNLIGR